MAVWRIRGGEESAFVSHFRDNDVVALGFYEIGDARGLDRDAIAHAILPRHPDLASARRLAHGLLNFVNVMTDGDVVVVPDPDTTEILLGYVDGPYQWKQISPVPEYRHLRKVRWV